MSARAPDNVVTAAAALVLFAFCAIAIWYTLQPAYFDAAEPTIPAVAAVFAGGGPLYPALDAPERYAHIYGPVLFIIHALVLTMAGPGMAASKAVGAAAVFASLAAGYRAMKPAGGSGAATWGTSPSATSPSGRVPIPSSCSACQQLCCRSTSREVARPCGLASRLAWR
jgi:hypothetical protein